MIGLATVGSLYSAFRRK